MALRDKLGYLKITDRFKRNWNSRGWDIAFSGYSGLDFRCSNSINQLNFLKLLEEFRVNSLFFYRHSVEAVSFLYRPSMNRFIFFNSKEVNYESRLTQGIELVKKRRLLVSPQNEPNVLPDIYAYIFIPKTTPFDGGNTLLPFDNKVYQAQNVKNKRLLLAA